MDKVHMRLDGTWVACNASQRPCPRLFHLTNMSSANARLLPSGMFEQLAAVLDPPHVIRPLFGYAAWYDRMDLLHRDHDLPAEVSRFGSKWYKHGRLHRGHDRPAVLENDGTRAWYQRGKLHRIGKPALVFPDGRREWHEAGVKHRGGDLPAVEGPGLYREWRLYGQLQRPSLEPALILEDGKEFWYVEGEVVAERVPGEDIRWTKTQRALAYRTAYELQHSVVN